jgi:hypothetical protein
MFTDLLSRNNNWIYFSLTDVTSAPYLPTVGFWHMYEWREKSLGLNPHITMDSPQPPVIGLVTLEDIIESLLQVNGFDISFHLMYIPEFYQ